MSAVRPRRSNRLTYRQIVAAATAPAINAAAACTVDFCLMIVSFRAVMDSLDGGGNLVTRGSSRGCLALHATQFRAEHRDHGLFDRRQRGLGAIHPRRPGLRRDGSSVEVRVENGRVNVALAADRLGVAQLFRDAFDRTDNLALRFALRAEGARL